MVKAGWLREDIPSAQHPLTNGNFRASLFRHGFDWMPAGTEGVRIEESPAEGLIRLQFSGNEPEHCVVLQQYMPMEAGRTYSFGMAGDPRSRVTALSGLTWHLRPVGNAAEVGLASSDLGLAQAGNWKMRAPQGSELYLLTLEYARPLGHLRAKGDFHSEICFRECRVASAPLKSKLNVSEVAGPKSCCLRRGRIYRRPSRKVSAR